MADVPGKCSVPMWWGDGMPAGACGKPAYGKRPPCRQYRDGWTGRLYREDGRFNGYVPDLACEMHGGPKAPDRCPEGCQGIDLGDGNHSGCECKGATCDCPNHPAADGEPTR